MKQYRSYYRCIKCHSKINFDIDLTNKKPPKVICPKCGQKKVSNLSLCSLLLLV